LSPKSLTQKRKKKTPTRKFNSLAEATTASILIDTHYEKLNIQGRWNRTRVERLCGYLRITQAELASIVGVNHKNFRRFISKNRFPLTAGILLTLLETHYLSGLAPDIIDEIFNYG
jgi:predicted DNA-binding protein (UPF0251 family)